jgi:hypothetical protein
MRLRLIRTTENVSRTPQPNGDRLYAVDSYRGRVCVYERRGAVGR